MKTIPLAEAADRAREIAASISAGGLVCFPMRGAYRIAADVRSEAAVTRLMQSKRRAKTHPALILVADLASAKSVVGGTHWKTTKQFAARMWPGPLTLVLPPSDDLPIKVRKVLTKATGKLGVRVPDDALTAKILAAVGGPMLLSSANHERKPGASSASAVKQRFESAVDIWVDAGDLKPATASTIIEVSETTWKTLRDGAISLADLERAAA